MARCRQPPNSFPKPVSLFFVFFSSPSSPFFPPPNWLVVREHLLHPPNLFLFHSQFSSSSYSPFSSLLSPLLRDAQRQATRAPVPSPISTFSVSSTANKLAAATAYGPDMKISRDADESHIIVHDPGEGTIDVSLLGLGYRW
ncbi:hypothetical protein M407DRAFT_107835 [Tulasnella calospora MUT 4182]|uniref:Uncharacterized protein n=1 Tax=Tulasnella calospora MUT 4182 TaxID=1051891 RepID=A0A0C3Q430_9AGAM|nr:hypothetical protein M407DRAFT_107835 [Tulasnella calospora MUT 4182]